MISKPSVSVIIPVYNRPVKILRALDSVRLQTCAVAETIVIDDGSTDGTISAVTDYMNRHESFPIRLLTQTNAGPSAARNRGLQEMSSDLIAFLDSDDEWKPEKIQEQVDFMTNHGEAAMVFSDFEDIRHGKLVWPSYLSTKRSYGALTKAGPIVEGFYDLLMKENFVPLSTVMIRRDVIKKIGLFDEELKCGEDWHLWLRAGRIAPVGLQKKVYVRKYVNGDNISYDPMLSARSMIQFLEKAKKIDPAYAVQNHRFFSRKLSESYYGMGRLELSERRIVAARRSFLDSAREQFNWTSLSCLAVTFLGVRIVDGIARFRKRVRWSRS